MQKYTIVLVDFNNFQSTKLKLKLYVLLLTQI